MIGVDEQIVCTRIIFVHFKYTIMNLRNFFYCGILVLGALQMVSCQKDKVTDEKKDLEY